MICLCADVTYIEQGLSRNEVSTEVHAIWRSFSELTRSRWPNTKGLLKHLCLRGKTQIKHQPSLQLLFMVHII